MASIQDMLAVLESAVPIIRASQFMTVSGFTVLMYDYLLTLSAEVELIWNSRLSTISVIFLANRYLVPLIYIVDLFDRMGLYTNSTVLIWIWVEAYLMMMSFASVHALVAMRVHALHGGRKVIKWILWVGGLLYILSTMAILAVALYVRNHDLAPAPIFHICFEEIAPFLWTIWLPSLAYEGLLFTLTIWKAIQEARRQEYSPITAILYRDGIVYFFAISGCSIMTMLVWVYGSPLMAGLVKYWTFAMVNVAGSRLVLNFKVNANAIQHYRNRNALTHGSFGNSPFDPDQYIGLDDMDGHYPSVAIGTMFPAKPATHFEAI